MMIVISLGLIFEMVLFFKTFWFVLYLRGSNVRERLIIERILNLPEILCTPNTMLA